MLPGESSVDTEWRSSPITGWGGSFENYAIDSYGRRMGNRRRKATWLKIDMDLSSMMEGVARDVLYQYWREKKPWGRFGVDGDENERGSAVGVQDNSLFRTGTVVRFRQSVGPRMEVCAAERSIENRKEYGHRPYVQREALTDIENNPYMRQVAGIRPLTKKKEEWAHHMDELRRRLQLMCFGWMSAEPITTVRQPGDVEDSEANISLTLRHSENPSPTGMTFPPITHKSDRTDARCNYWAG